MSFDSLKLNPALLKNISSLGFKVPTVIQEQAIPIAIMGRDLLGIAKTGSGKSASFLIPIINKLLADRNTQRNRQPKVLILVPTRELAMQLAEVTHALSKNLDRSIKSMAVYGGVSINPQMKGLYGVEILIATPGRLLDLHRSNALSLHRVNTLVLDEADKILNLGFEAEMKDIIHLLPKEKQTMLFSATLSKQLEGIQKLLLSNPIVIETETVEQDASLINLSGYFVSDDRKGPLLRHLIQEMDMKQVLVFASSRQKADKIAGKLFRNGINALSIHGKKSQGQRTDALDRFKAGKLQVLVATDLISRGIDIQELPFVINYELPRSPKDFIHRVGRTGRAASEGLAITFVTKEETHHFKVILKKMKRYIDMIDSDSLEI